MNKEDVKMVINRVILITIAFIVAGMMEWYNKKIIKYEKDIRKIKSSLVCSYS